MDSSLSFLKPKMVLPSYLLNGTNHTSHPSSPLGRTSVNAKERDKLTASIKSSHNGRQPINLDSDDVPQTYGYRSYPPGDEYEEVDEPTNLDVSARDPRDEAAHPEPTALSRPASPYTQNPPIDFDGLSWPSESTTDVQVRYIAERPNRSWDQRATRSHPKASGRAPPQARRGHSDYS